MYRVLSFALTFCAAASAASAQTVDLKLVEWDGTAMDAAITLTEFGQSAIAGNAPCNRFFGQITQLAGDQIAIGPLAATKRACPDLALEQKFLTALQSMTRISRAEGTIVLGSDEGASMVFTRSRD